jgi:hypothetical protein
MLTYILTSLCKKSGYSSTLPPLPLPLDFSVLVISDHPKAGVWPTYFYLQFGAMPVNIPVTLQSYTKQSVGISGSSVGSALLLFLVELKVVQRSGPISKTIALN